MVFGIMFGSNKILKFLRFWEMMYYY